jgi:hypothetical protein
MESLLPQATLQYKKGSDPRKQLVNICISAMQCLQIRNKVQ